MILHYPHCSKSKIDMDSYLNAKTKLVIQIPNNVRPWQKNCEFNIIVSMYTIIDQYHLESLRYVSSQLNNPKLNKLNDMKFNFKISLQVSPDSGQQDKSE